MNIQDKITQLRNTIPIPGKAGQAIQTIFDETNNNNNRLGGPLFRQPLLQLPSDDNDDDDIRNEGKLFIAETFNGPKVPSKRLHNLPRFGYTNDIASLVSFSKSLNIKDNINIPILSNLSTQEQEVVEVRSDVPVPLIDKSYSAQDADDYIRGIASISILVMVIYILWGLTLLLLRMGRMDCCFRGCKWCGKKCKSCKRRKASAAADADEEDVNDDDDDESIDEGQEKECCLYACHDTLAAKGGCCSRICCGWMSGRPPKLPTKQSLIREKELREKQLVNTKGVEQMGRNMVSSVTQGVHSSVMDKIGTKKKKMDVGDEEEEEEKAVKADGAAIADAADDNSDRLEVDAAVAETAVAAADENNPPQDPIIKHSAATNTTAADTTITEEYINKRRGDTQRTMLIIRIIFLISSTIVLIASTVLLIEGWKGVNGIVNGSIETLQIVEGQLEGMLDGIGQYIQTNNKLREKRLEFLERTSDVVNSMESSNNSTILGRLGWCPQSIGDGKIEITLSLSKLLIKGNLMKLAFVDKATDKMEGFVGDISDKVAGSAEGIVDTAQDTLSTVMDTSAALDDAVENVNASQIGTRREQALNETGIVDKVTDAAQGVKDDAVDAIGDIKDDVVNVVGDIKEEVAGVADDIKEGAQEVIENIPDDMSGLVDNINASKVVESTREQAVTVITFLDELVSDQVGSLIGKVFGLKDQVQDNIGEGDGNKIAIIVDKLRELVQKLVVRVKDEFGGDDNTNRFLLDVNGTVNNLRQSMVEKDGINYTVIDFVDDLGDPTDFIGDKLVVNGFDLTQLLTNNITLTIDVKTITETIGMRLNSTSSYFLDVFTKLHTGIEKLYNQSQNGQETLESILPWYYLAVVFVGLIILITLIFMVGTILAWNGKQHCLIRHCQDHILCPIFIICGLFMWIFTTVFLALGVVSGDFCFQSPDNQVNQILEETISEISNIAFNFAFFYVNGCPAEYRPKLMTVVFKAVTLARTGISEFFGIIGNFGAKPLSHACGIESDSSINALSALARSIKTQFESATVAIFSMAELLLCRSFSPLYTSLTYRIVCTDFINLIAPLLWSMFFISIFSMVMVTLRVAWHELVDDIDVDNVIDGVNEEEEDIVNVEIEGDVVEKLDAVDERDEVSGPEISIQDNEVAEQEDGDKTNLAGIKNKEQSLSDGHDNLDIQNDNVDEEKEKSGAEDKDDTAAKEKESG